MDDAQRVIAELQLAPHPEGGWYRETWRAGSPAPGERDAATAILFLLEQGQKSHWHRIDAAELWLFHAGGPLLLRAAAIDGQRRDIRLGSNILAGEQPQHLIAPGEWQAAEASEGWSLVACVVVPGFSFEGFELAAPGWAPDAAKDWR
jgi:predicted cupin superfamily sugar epimerase